MPDMFLNLTRLDPKKVKNKSWDDVVSNHAVPSTKDVAHIYIPYICT